MYFKQNVHFMGHTPARITYSSDYFGALYDLAVLLIERGFAYVDHQTKAEIEACREKRANSPYGRGGSQYFIFKVEVILKFSSNCNFKLPKYPKL